MTEASLIGSLPIRGPLTANCCGPVINRSASRVASISLEIIGPGTDEPPASRAPAANCFGAAINRSASRASAGNCFGAAINQQVRIRSISLETIESHTHEQPPSRASPREQQISITSVSWKIFGSDTHERPALRAVFANLLWPRHQQVSITSISWKIFGCGIRERPASPASAGNCFGPAINRSASRASAWNHVGLAHTNGQHHQHQLRIALSPIDRSASSASAANWCALQSTDQHYEQQFGNHWAWHRRTASITSISCELLWCRYQQASITSISLEP